MNLHSLPQKAYSNHGHNSSDVTKNTDDNADKLASTDKTNIDQTTQKNKKEVEKTVTDKKSDISTQEKIVNNIKILQNKIHEVRTDPKLTKEQSDEQLTELKTQLNEQLQSVQIIIKKQTSTLIQGLFANNSASHSGMILNQKA
jgi:preprotein translocase subunit SecD